MVNVAVAVTAVLDNKYFEDVFAQKRAEYKNREKDIVGLQTKRIYCHINGLKIQQILITSSKHVLMVKLLIYEILLNCHKWHQIFQAFKWFSEFQQTWLGQQFSK